MPKKINPEKWEREILKHLKRYKRLSTSRIAGLINHNNRYTKRFLENLKIKGEIKEIKETVATYYVLREKNKEK